MNKILTGTKFCQITLVCWISVGLLFASPALAKSKLTRITDSVYAYVDARDDSASNSFGANAGVIIGENGVLVVDTFISKKIAQDFLLVLGPLLTSQ